MAKTTPWLEIKTAYLKGVTPKELALKYKIKAKAISDKANEEKWVAEKSKISENVRKKTEDKIEQLTNLALNTLQDVILDDTSRNSDRVSAAKAILDISGLKSSKQETTISGDISHSIQNGFDSMDELVKHFKETIGE